MQVGEILKEKHPEVYKKLNKKKKERKERLSFYDIEKLMSEGHVYKRTKSGAWRQIK